MTTNLKDTYAIKIKPDFDKKNIDKFKKDVEHINVRFLGNTFAGATSKVAGLIGGLTLLGFAISSIKKGFDDANKGVNEFLSTTDRLSTLAGAMPSTSSGQLALTDIAIGSAGVNVQERDLLFRNIQKALETKSLQVTGQKDISSIISGLQVEFQKATKNNDIAKMEQIQAIIGLRGQKALEFLQGNLKQTEQDLLKQSGVKSVDILTRNIEYGGALEGQQATLNSINQLQSINKTSQTLQEKSKVGGTRGQNIVESQAKTVANQTNLLQEQIRGFDASRKASESLDNTIKSLESTLQEGVNQLAPALNSINSTINELKQGVSIKNVATQIGKDIAGAVVSWLKGGGTPDSKQVKK